MRRTASPRLLLAAAMAAVLPACEAGDDEGSSSDPCAHVAPTPADAPFVRVTNQHATDDPTSVRLCTEGATPPEQLSNPWDLHCEVASGRGSTQDEDVGPKQLRIVEWNIEFGTELAEIGALLDSHPVLSQADVLLLAEVDRGCNRSGQADVTRTLADARQMDWVFGVEFVEHAQGGCEEGNAVLSRYPLANAFHRFHDVGRLDRDGLHAPYDWSLDADEPRTGRRSFVGADVRLGSGLLTVVAGHLENRSNPDERAAEVSEVIAFLAGMPRSRACIAGDFNVFPDVGSVIVDAPLFDVLAAACFENPHADMPQSERRTRPSINYQIDFTYLRGVKVLDRGVVNDLSSVPSDHYPVWVDVASE